MPKDFETKNYTWLEIQNYCGTLAALIKATSFSPNIIVGVLRGGCMPALCLSHLLDIRKLYTIKIETTLTEEIRSQRKRPEIDKSQQFKFVENEKVLIVDDVTNTGDTIKSAKLFIQQFQPNEIKTAALLWDTVCTDNFLKQDQHNVDFFVKKVHAWVHFPWEK